MKKALLFVMAMAISAVYINAQDLTGTIWEDSDGDGIANLPADGLANITVSLVDCNTGALITATTNPVMTDADGDYSFTGIVDGGPYCIEIDESDIELPAGFDWCTTEMNTDSDADPNQTGAIFQAGSFDVPDDPNAVLNIGIYTLQEITGEIFVDENNDDVFSGAELLFDDCVTITLYNSDASIAEECDGTPIDGVNTSSGTYTLNNVPPGDYYVEFYNICDFDCNGTVFTANFSSAGGAVDVFTNDSDVTEANGDGTTETFTLTSQGTGIEVDAGVFGYLLSTISGDLFEDIDDDGIFGGPDLVLSTCVTVCVMDDNTGGIATDCDGVQLCEITSTGEYEFFENVPPGDYFMQFDAWCDLSCMTAPELGMSDGGAVETFTNDNDASNDLGGGVFTTPVFNVNGDADPQNWTMQDWDVDAGVTGVVLSTIEGEIWEDLNNDGIQGGAEPLLTTCVDVCVYDSATGGIAQDCDGVDLCVNTTDGTYQFSNNVLPGDYWIQFDNFCEVCAGGGAYAADSDGGTVDEFINDNDADGTNGGGPGMTSTTTPTFNIDPDVNPNPTEVDAGLYGAAEICGETWEDTNGNTMQDGTEPLIGTFVVSLDFNDPVTGWGPANDVSGAAVPDQNSGGTYCFDNLPPGEYQVNFDPGACPPAAGAYVLTFTTDGTADDPTTAADDSDACYPNCNGADDGDTGTFNIESCQEIEDVDAGYYQAVNIHGKVFKDGDGNGVNDNGSPDFAWDALNFTPPPITVTLTHADGSAVSDICGDAVAAIVVDENTAGGEYCFMNLHPGEYIVNFSNPGAPWMISELGANVDPSENGGVNDADPGSGNTATITAESGELTDCTNADESVDVGFYKLMQIAGLIFNDADMSCVWEDGVEGVIGNITIVIEGTDCPGGMDFGPIEVDNDIITGEWETMEEVPPCACMTVYIHPDEFDIATGTIPNHEGCGTAEDIDEGNAGGVTNNGDFLGNGGFGNECFEFFCGELPDMGGMALLTLDFGVTFECTGSTTTPLWPDCETAEIDTGCDPGDFNYICDIDNLNNYCGTMESNATMSGPSPTLCPSNGGGVSHNTYWVAFIAGDNVAAFDLDLMVSNCTGGGGVQWGIVSTCPEHDNIICDGGCNGNATINIQTDLMEPGELYYLWVDGCNNDVCDIQFTLNDGGGTFDYPNIETSDCSNCLATSEPDNNEYDLCTGAFGQSFCIYDGGGVYENLEVEYYWNLDEEVDGIPSFTDQDGNLGFTDENCISLDFPSDGSGVYVEGTNYPPGDYELCMTWVGTCCDNEGPYCITIDIADPAPKVFDPLDICQNDFINGDYIIEDIDTDGDGNPDCAWFGAYPTDFEDEFVENEYGGDIPNTPLPGCTTNQSILLTDLEVAAKLYQTVFCSTDQEAIDGEWIVGEDIGDPQEVPVPTGGNPEEITFLGAAANGCDSIVFYTVEVLEIDGVLEQDICDPSLGVLIEWENSLNDDPFSQYENVAFYWFNTTDYPDPGPPYNATTVSMPDQDGILEDIFVYSSGTYYLVIHAEIPYTYPEDHGGNVYHTCDFTFEIPVTLNDPPQPIITGEEQMCAPGGIATYMIDDATYNGLGINWIVTGGTAIQPTANQTEIEVDWTGTTGGTITVDVGGLCGLSFSDPFEVTIIPAPVASIADAGPVCVDECIDLVYDGAPEPMGSDYVYAWDFDDGVEGSGNPTTGPGPYCVTWATTGTKTVTLTITDGDCVSNVAMTTVEVVGPPEPPTITCTDTGIDFVEFTVAHSDMSLINNFNFTLDAGVPGTGVANGNQYTVSGLSTGATVTGSFTYEDAINGCATEPIPFSCVAQDCPPQDITFDAILPICLTSDVMAFQLTPNLNGLVGTEEYAGTGVSMSGLFDPTIAGPGTHMISLLFIEDVTDCQYTSSVTITVVDLPDASFTTVSPVCVGELSAVAFTGSPVPDGGYQWTVPAGSNQGVLNGAGGDLSFDVEGTYTITLTTTHEGCESEPVMVDIVVDPQVPNPVVNCVNQTTSSVEFGWTEEPGINYTVTQTNVPANGTVNESSGSFIVTDLNEGQDVEIIVVAESPNSCPDGMTPWMCTAQACPGAAIDLGADQTVCFESDAFVLVPSSNNPAVDISAEVGTWSIDPAGAGIDQNGEFDPTASGPGDFTVTVEYLIGDCEYSGSVMIEVLGEGNVILDPDFVICETEAAVQLNGVVEDVSLNNPVVTWTGSGVSTSGMFDPGTANIGTNLITYTVNDDNGCTYIGTMEITVDPEITMNDPICAVSIDMIEVTWEDHPCADDFVMTSIPSGVQNGNSYTVTGLTEGQTVDFSLTMVSNCACPWSMDFSCTANDCPPVTLNVEDHLTSMCVNDNVAPFNIGVTVAGSDGSGSGEWTGTGITSNGLFDPSIGPGTYDFTYTWLEMNCPFVAFTSVVVNANPEIILDAVSPDCYLNNLGVLTATVSGGTGNLTVTMDGATINGNTPIDVAPNTYNVIVTDANGCTAEASATITPAVEPLFEIDGITQGVFPETLTFNVDAYLANIENVESITWTLDTVIICQGLECNSVSLDSMVLFSEELCAEVVYNDGCFVDDCVTVSIIQVTQNYFPNIISPNGDGMNDEWIIGSNDIGSIQYVSIYDRWGERVFTAENLELDQNNEVAVWDGTMKDKDVVPGVYVFVLEYTSIDGTDKLVESGDITVIKN